MKEWKFYRYISQKSKLEKANTGIGRTKNNPLSVNLIAILDNKQNLYNLRQRNEYKIWFKV